MVTWDEIEELGRAIGREFNPSKVIVFGSYAYGMPNQDSDVDLCVIMPHQGKGWRAATEIRGRIRPAFPMDLVVRTPEQARERLAIAAEALDMAKDVRRSLGL